MVRTRVGYAGGTINDPTYDHLGDHTEAIQLDYDPTWISYDELLDVFWESHHPAKPPGSTQYKAAVFFHNEDQKRQAIGSRDQVAAIRGDKVYTEILPFSRFYLAEAYHQKYRLRQRAGLLEEFRTIYPAIEDFIDSTAVARMNGYVSGHGTLEEVQAVLPSLGLSQEGGEELLDIVAKKSLKGCNEG